MEFPKLEPGSTIAGRYELIDKLGAGAFGAVFRARQLGIDRQVALKVLMPEAESVDSTAVARFQREAKLSSSLEHPNTITIHDYGEWNGLFYLVMEYVRGTSLRETLRRDGGMEPARAVRICRQILSSLQEAHSRGIIHRDMKPANIMLFDRVGESDVVKVLDFGIAKFISNDAAVSGPGVAEKDLTVAGRIVGTPRYMAPEQIRGTGPSPRSDLYALGLMLFEMLVGERAVSGDSTISLIAAKLSDEPLVNYDNPRIPAVLRPILQCATAKDQDERYANAAEFMAALDAVDLNAADAGAQGALATDTTDDIAASSGSRHDEDRDAEVQSRSSGAGLVLMALVGLVGLVAVAIVAVVVVSGGDEGQTEGGSPLPAAVAPAVEEAQPVAEAPDAGEARSDDMAAAAPAAAPPKEDTPPAVDAGAPQVDVAVEVPAEPPPEVVPKKRKRKKKGPAGNKKKNYEAF